MTMHQLIYASRPFGFDEAALNGILVEARRFNAEHDITGALICRHDLYLQLLEGPQDIVETLYRRIAVDARHLEVELLVAQPVGKRLFPKWAMLDDPAQSWVWSMEAVARGATESESAGQEALGFFERLAATR